MGKLTEAGRPDWMDDETKMPPYPLLRCDWCKAIFSDHAIHICKDITDAGRAALAQQKEQSNE